MTKIPETCWANCRKSSKGTKCPEGLLKAINYFLDCRLEIDFIVNEELKIP
jgi:hypothetical protein